MHVSLFYKLHQLIQVAFMRDTGNFRGIAF
jgi:hypothetical protein